MGVTSYCGVYLEMLACVGSRIHHFDRSNNSRIGISVDACRTSDLVVVVDR
jgi:hypothetical protein